MAEKVKVGLVGAGPWAHMVHAPILANSPDTELVGIWARRRQAADELAAKHNTAAAATYEELLDRCDGVAFCVPPDVQATMAITAAKARKTLLLEKPIALALPAALELVDAVDAAGVGTVVLLSLRYADTVRSFLDEARTIGRPLGGRMAFVSGALLGGSPFATPWRLERGALPDLGPHALDLIDAALGPIVDVVAKGDALGWVSLLCTHENGATSTVNLCASAPQGGMSRIEVFGDAGTAKLDASSAADATSMLRVPAALAAAHRGEATDAPDVHRGLHLQKIIEAAGSQLS